MDERELRDRIDQRLDELDARRWLRRLALVAAVSGATGGVHALDAGVASKVSADAALDEDGGDDYDAPPSVAIYSVDIDPGCGGA